MNTQAKDILSKEKRKELDYLVLQESAISQKNAVGKQFMSTSVLGLGFLLYIYKDLNCSWEKITLAGSAGLFLFAIFVITKSFDKASKYFSLRIDIIVENDLAKKQLLKDEATLSNHKFKCRTNIYKTAVYLSILLCIVLALRVLF